MVPLKDAVNRLRARPSRLFNQLLAFIVTIVQITRAGYEEHHCVPLLANNAGYAQSERPYSTIATVGILETAFRLTVARSPLLPVFNVPMPSSVKVVLVLRH